MVTGRSLSNSKQAVVGTRTRPNLLGSRSAREYKDIGGMEPCCRLGRESAEPPAMYVGVEAEDAWTAVTIRQLPHGHEEPVAFWLVHIVKP